MKQPKLSNLAIDVKGTKNIREKMAGSKKTKITINIEQDILSVVRSIAEETGVPYQVLMNRFLREALIRRSEKETRLQRLEKDVATLKKKISA